MTIFIYLDTITIAYGEGMGMEQLENMDQDTCLVRESIVTKPGKTGCNRLSHPPD